MNFRYKKADNRSKGTHKRHYKTMFVLSKF